MYQKIVVPLDGSKLAECVLPHLEAIAQGCSTDEVFLVSVTEEVTGNVRPPGQFQLITPSPIPTTQPPPEAIMRVPISIGKKQKQAQRYLDRIARRLEKKKMKSGRKC